MTSRDVWVVAGDAEDALNCLDHNGVGATPDEARQNATGEIATAAAGVHHIRLTVVSPDAPEPAEVLERAREHLAGVTDIREAFGCCTPELSAWLAKLTKLLEANP